MKRFSFLSLALILSLCFIFSACSETSPAELMYGSNGEFNTPYTFDTSTIGADGKNFTNNDLRVLSVEKYETYSMFNIDFKNCIVVKCEGYLPDIKDFLSNKAYVSTCDSSNNLNISYGSGAGEIDDVVYCIFDTSTDISSQTHFAFGGFNESKNNGEDVFVFEIQ